MDNDYEVYETLSKMLDKHVAREEAENSVAAGEPESAISDLLDAAYSVGALSQDVVDYIESVYTGGPVIEMLAALRMLEEQRHH